MAVPRTYVGRGTKLLYSTDGSGFISVPQIKRFEPDGSRQIMADQTNLNSPGAFTQPYPTLIDCGGIDVQCVLDPQDPVYLALGAAHGRKTLLSWRAQLIDGSVFSFQAHIAEFKPFQVNVYKAYLYSFKLRIVGGMESPSSVFDPGVFDAGTFDSVQI